MLARLARTGRITGTWALEISHGCVSVKGGLTGEGLGTGDALLLASAQFNCLFSTFES